jgi:hypothetical protein
MKHYRVIRKFKGVDGKGKPKWYTKSVYLCNGAVLANKSKSTKIKIEVTCKNCMRKLGFKRSGGFHLSQQSC